MTNASLAEAFLAAHALNTALIEVAEPAYETIYDMELPAHEEKRRCDAISKRLGTQDSLDMYNAAESAMLLGLERFLSQHGRSDMFSTMMTRPVQCAEILIRG